MMDDSVHVKIKMVLVLTKREGDLIAHAKQLSKTQNPLLWIKFKFCHSE